ncbi:MAG: dephospho-CoA kinase [Candidatus Dactylopiibacterium carminicum]|uniref:Dephospho-CoA kinase n=1 Tax=Candidatus Dactylopiibacterium carminicum TaxID=857335 RepID=A0A272EZ87_9RHOO|nr:dephospho-CoA kinase [Candidatus Dactylopiibacterium carminicum]KAF7600898.1 dephospho-CoA kinase [Candidatus Dactylopiibacterium carminicum]PAS95413.1 MAG: dephospho-CoA kinase [Candidatus Dactylopiibacterium carminicum]PAS98728.1 MAG: dephospho-CoA kinase [Candidatus Dactylopiibacterium carminicum]
MQPERLPVVGLTGGIGSGKSSASQHFKALGITVVDTDAVSRQLTGVGGEAMSAIRQTFGMHMQEADGALDRAAMRHLVFSDPEARKQLEAILHPMIRARAELELRQACSPYAILEVPLLVESRHFMQRCNRILVIDCPPDLQLERVVARSNLSPAEVERIISAQASRPQRLAAASEVIENTGSLEDLKHSVQRMHEFYVLEFTQQKRGCYDAVTKAGHSGGQDR